MIEFFRKILDALSGLGSLFMLGFVTAVYFVFAVFVYYSRDLPDVADLKSYAPPTISRVYANTGQILDEFVEQKRIFTPIEEIPTLVQQAFISAEDKNFYKHSGVDVIAIISALKDSLKGNSRGASTIPQQVAKNMYVGNERSIERKLREMVLAMRVAEYIDRKQILELYLNEIFLGQNSYGVTAAARTYFSKSLEDLSLAEIAYLAILPKAPSNYHPVKEQERALERRNYVLREMYENLYISKADYESAIAEPLKTVQGGNYESYRTEIPPRDYFTDEVRRQLARELGDDALKADGLSVHATVDLELQKVAQKALRDGLERYDRGLGRFNGPAAVIDPALVQNLEQDWQTILDETRYPRDIEGWLGAVVLSVSPESARMGVDGKGPATLPFDSIAWARPTVDGRVRSPQSMQDILKIGDIIYLSVTDGAYKYRQIPKISGAFVALDPRNGRVISLIGGFSYEYSNFNRATQAMRQPGSAFKPFVYAAALDSGYAPNSIIVDAPVEISTPMGIWRPKNDSGGFFGPAPMMLGLERSRNLMTVRLAQDIGMDLVAEYGERYGVYDDLKPLLANALGSQETTAYRLVSAYANFANGGKSITPSVVDRVQDRYGKSIILHDTRTCSPCQGEDADPGKIPEITSTNEQVMDPITAFQIKTMLQSVVSHGTARNSVGQLKLPIAGKTGTTNDAKDVWFVGFTPKIVAGCYMGYDDPTPLGESAYGGTMCGPVFSNYITEALKTYAGFDYDVPPNSYFLKLDRKTGARLPDDASGPNVVTMLFAVNAKPRVGDKGTYIDGGFKMGSDLQIISPDQDPGAVTEIKVGDEVKRLPKNPSIGTISTGGLY